MKGNFSVAVVVMTPEGLVLVMDPSKSEPYWKFPGGHGWASESSQEAAVRELEEETGIVLNPYELELLGKEERKNGNNQEGSHDFFLFSVILSKLPRLKDEGNDGEKIKIFPFSFLGKSSFLPYHRQSMISFLMGKSPVS